MPTQQEWELYWEDKLSKRGYRTVEQVLEQVGDAIQQAYDSLPARKKRLSVSDVNQVKSKAAEILRKYGADRQDTK